MGWKQRAALLIGGAAFIAGIGLATGELVAPSAGRAMGADANDDPEGGKCRSGVAIDITLGHVCSDFCEADADCPHDWGCRQVPEGRGGTVGLCFPLRHVATP